MKKITAFFCLVCLICACEKSKVTEIENNVITEEEAFDLVLQSIDELNASYGYDETKAPGPITKKYMVAACDVFGGWIGSGIGQTLGAGVGVVTGNPVVGVVGYLAGRKYGGWAGFVGASAVADKLIPTGRIVHNPFVLTTLPASDNGYYIPEDLSMGDIHNFFLSRAVNAETPFVTPEESINSEVLFDALQELAEEYDVEDPLLTNDTWRETMDSYYDELAIVLKNASSINEDPEITVSKIVEIMENNGMPEEKTKVFTSVTSKLIPCVATLRPNRVKPYERDYIEIVKKSKVNYEKQMELIDVGSVAIMSSAYWHAK